MNPYAVKLARPAAKDLASAKIPRAIADAVLVFIEGPLASEPFRVGKPLDEPYRGLFSAHRGDYRVLYSVDADSRTVTIVAIRHKAKAYHYPG